MELDALVAARNDNTPLGCGPAAQPLPRAVGVARAPGIRDRVEGAVLALLGNGGNLTALGPAEHGDAVRVVGLRVSERGDYLAPRRAPDQRRDLGCYRDAGQCGSRRCVEEVDALIVRSTTCSN